MRSQAIAVVLAGLTMMVGGEYVGAASHALGADITGTINAAAVSWSGGTRPGISAKAPGTGRGRYDRVHPLDAIQ